MSPVWRRARTVAARGVRDARARLLGAGRRGAAYGPDPDLVPPAEPLPLSRDRVAEDLARRGYRFRLDGEGDVTGTWDGNRFWFLLLGAHGEILQVRGRWSGTIAPQARLSVLQAVNDWNRDRVWPKVYVREEPDGLALYAEVSVDFEHGATDEQLAATLSCGLVTATQFFSTVGALTPGD